MFEHRRHGVADIFAGQESLTADTISAAESEITSRIGQGIPRIIVDLEEVPLIDSAGLEFLLETKTTCASRGGMMVLARPNSLCQDILRITGVKDELEVFNDVLTAAGSFAV